MSRHNDSQTEGVYACIQTYICIYMPRHKIWDMSRQQRNAKKEQAKEQLNAHSSSSSNSSAEWELAVGNKRNFNRPQQPIAVTAPLLLLRLPLLLRTSHYMPIFFLCFTLH